MIENFQKLEKRINSNQEPIMEKTNGNVEKYKIIVEWDQGRREININKNLTINNLSTNLADVDL